jgi:hypothetical protein
MKKAVAVLRSAVGAFALGGVVVLAGCGDGGGGSSPKALVGQWSAVNGEIVGEEMELFSDGKAVYKDDGVNLSGTWCIVDKRFVMSASVFGTDMSEATDYKISGYELTLVDSKGDTAIYVRKEKLDEYKAKQSNAK